jgi:hypothetical protein
VIDFYSQMNFWIQFFGTSITALLGCSLFARFGGYYKEKGKRLATHEDIANVLEQVKAVTRETETIKAQIGTELWSQQTIWNAKRDLYANALSSLVATRTSLVRIDVRSNDTQFQLSQAQFESEVHPALEKLLHNSSLSEIFLNTEAIDAFLAFRTLMKTIEEMASGQSLAGQLIEGLDALRSSLIVAARKDLNIKG